MLLAMPHSYPLPSSLQSISMTAVCASSFGPMRREPWWKHVAGNWRGFPTSSKLPSESGGHLLRAPQLLHLMTQRQQPDSGGAGATSKCNEMHEMHLLPSPALEIHTAYRDR